MPQYLGTLMMNIAGSSETFVISVRLGGVTYQNANLHGDRRKNSNLASLQLTLSCGDSFYLVV
jgi:hypothetical protein